MDQYAVYWMLTPLCVLNCGYCFRDCSPASVASELSLENKKKAVEALYRLNVRKLTLSGGEPLFIGGNKVSDFLSLIDFIKRYKYPKNKESNLRIELLTNAVLLEDWVLDKLVGVVDRITITVDSVDDNILTRLGRNYGQHTQYLERFKKRIKSIKERGFDIKLHSVITPVNYDGLLDVVAMVLSHQREYPITKWKFYQYMTYNDPAKDEIYSISDERYASICEKINEMCQGSGIELAFKDNKTMEDSMVNLSHAGRIEAFKDVNGVRTKVISRSIWEYESMDELKEELGIDASQFDRFHKLS